MLRGRAGQGMSVNIIIIAAIALIILVILIVLVLNATNNVGDTTNRCLAIQGAVCEDYEGAGCPVGYTVHPARTCPADTGLGGNVRCCIPIGGQ